MLCALSELLLGRLDPDGAGAGHLQLDGLPRALADGLAPADVRGDVDVDLTDVAHVCLRVDDDLRIVRTDLQRNRAPVREDRDASLAVQLRREQSLTGHGAAYCSAHTALRRESDYRTLEVAVVCAESVGFDGEH